MDMQAFHTAQNFLAYSNSEKSKKNKSAKSKFTFPFFKK
ncbi:MAG: hypothetical protein ACJAT7_001395 [Psychromonas sp.]|jgi:hypothetical protein